MGGPVPIGGRKANLTQYNEAHLQEVALNEQARPLVSVLLLPGGHSQTACSPAAGGLLLPSCVAYL